MEGFTTLDYRVEDRVARITLDRPDAGNAMNLTLVTELAAAALRADLDPAVRAVLLDANGRMFCVGGDLKAFAGYGDQAAARLKEVADGLHKAISVFARMAAPLVIAVHGPAAGAGFSLCLNGEYVLAAESAKFTMAYTAAGLSPDGGSTYHLPRLVGRRRAQELLIDNRTLTAAEAHEWGLITAVVPDADLPQRALETARRLAAGPSGSWRAVKELLLASEVNSLEAQLELEARAIARAVASPDGVEGISAFLGKRKPTFP